jgi:hypothetical protein
VYRACRAFYRPRLSGQMLLPRRLPGCTAAFTLTRREIHKHPRAIFAVRPVPAEVLAPNSCIFVQRHSCYIDTSPLRTALLGGPQIPLVAA